jgi:hypothetical protein
MIDTSVKMECSGCHKLIPTIQFYDHLIDSKENENLDGEQRNYTCEDEANYLNMIH